MIEARTENKIVIFIQTEVWTPVKSLTNAVGIDFFSDFGHELGVGSYRREKQNYDKAKSYKRAHLCSLFSAKIERISENSPFQAKKMATKGSADRRK